MHLLTRTLPLLTIALGLSACHVQGRVVATTGGADTTGASSGTTAAGPACGARLAEVDALHQEIAPIVHGEAGAARAAAACEHASSFQSRARSIQAIALTGTCADAWTRATARLVQKSERLVRACQASGPAVEQRLESFHEAFDAVIAIAGGESAEDVHAEHGHDEHGHGDPHQDGEHGDPHADGQHGDPHADGQHGDPHADAQHGDPHADAQHGDPHADAQHGDPHADAQHGDPHADAQHGDPHADAQHGDPHADGAHGDPHGTAGGASEHGHGHGHDDDDDAGVRRGHP